MTTRHSRPSPFRRFAIRAFGAAFVAYFGYHAFHGDHGLMARHRLYEEIGSLSVELASLERERQGLERRVSLMRPETLDPDMLDERMRAALNVAHPDEIILLRRQGEITEN